MIVVGIRTVELVGFIAQTYGCLSIGNLCRTNKITSLKAVTLTNNAHCERLFNEPRPRNDDVQAEDFCLRCVQRRERNNSVVDT